jgi:hypothetical protein
MMKKIVLLVLTLTMFIFVVPTTQATDICTNDPLESADFNVEIKSAVFLRTVSCMEESEVIATLSAGEVVHVIGKVEDWHKIERADGTQGWVWVDFVQPTTKPFNPTITEEPEPEPELYTEPEPETTYDPMYDISGHKYEEAIWHVYNNGIVQGYEDGSYKPDKKINRAELLKIIVESKYDDEFNVYIGADCFSDVPPQEWYTKYVCFGQNGGFVEGYGDGTFKPGNEINFVEALKIIMIGYDYEYVKGNPWFMNVLETASGLNFIPLDVTAFDELLTRGQMAEMITRIMKYKEEKLDEYLGDAQYYKVTYETIDAGINVEDYVGTGKCIYEDEVYETGESFEMSECTTCACAETGNWLCTGLCVPEEEA